MSVAITATRQHLPTVAVSARRYRFELLLADGDEVPSGQLLNGPRDVALLARAIIGSELTECMLAFFLDARHRVIGYAEVARGTLNSARLTARDVLVPALLANARSVVVAHNHPSGEPTPSTPDRRLTATLREATDLIGVPLVDHVIVTPRSSYSFRDAEGW